MKIVGKYIRCVFFRGQSGIFEDYWKSDFIAWESSKVTLLVFLWKVFIIFYFFYELYLKSLKSKKKCETKV